MARPFAVLILLAAMAVAAPARAQPLVADLSDHLVKITLGFEGSELLLFGAVEGPGDVVVVVYGPAENVTVRRKERTGVIWMNRDEMSFVNVPAFYQVMATRPIGEWLPESVRERHQIGVEHLDLSLRDAIASASPEEVGNFRSALIRRKRDLGHYSTEAGTVSMLSARLFRAEVVFPTNVPTGTYTVEVFLVVDGDVVSAQTTPLYISKIGILAEIFHLANVYAALYGLAAILFAVLAGLGANALFRRV